MKFILISLLLVSLSVSLRVKTKTNQVRNFITKDLDNPSSFLVPDLLDINNNSGFIQKSEKTTNIPKISDGYDAPGFLNAKNMILKKQTPNFRFKENDDETEPLDQFENQLFFKTSPNTPAKGNELIRQQGISNGIVLKNGKRTCNFETGAYQK